MTELEKHCRFLLEHGEDNPTNVKIYSWTHGLIAVIANDNDDRKEFISSVILSTAESKSINERGFVEFGISKLEQYCLEHNPYAKIVSDENCIIKVRFNDKYNQEITLDGSIPWTLKEVKLFNSQGCIEFGVDPKVWVRGDKLRNIKTMEPVTFIKYSNGGSFFFSKEKFAGLQTCNYKKLPGDNE